MHEHIRGNGMQYTMETLHKIWHGKLSEMMLVAFAVAYIPFYLQSLARDLIHKCISDSFPMYKSLCSYTI